MSTEPRHGPCGSEYCDPTPESVLAEPVTAAGRTMLHDWHLRRTHPPTAARQEAYRQFILAIEAEAVATRDAELRAAVEGLPRILMAYPEDDPVHRAAVLALLEPPR